MSSKKQMTATPQQLNQKTDQRNQVTHSAQNARAAMTKQQVKLLTMTNQGTQLHQVIVHECRDWEFSARGQQKCLALASLALPLPAKPVLRHLTAPSSSDQNQGASTWGAPCRSTPSPGSSGPCRTLRRSRGGR